MYQVRWKNLTAYLVHRCPTCARQQIHQKNEKRSNYWQEIPSKSRRSWQFTHERTPLSSKTKNEAACVCRSAYGQCRWGDLLSIALTFSLLASVVCPAQAADGCPLESIERKVVYMGHMGGRSDRTYQVLADRLYRHPFGANVGPALLELLQKLYTAGEAELGSRFPLSPVTAGELNETVGRVAVRCRPAPVGISLCIGAPPVVWVHPWRTSARPWEKRLST